LLNILSIAGLKFRRDEASFEKYLAVSHLTGSDFKLDTPAAQLFGSNATCALVPEVTIGPYYVEGELIRTDITDGQGGVPVHLDIQFVDISSCAAVPELLIDIWHCNATGVYSGVVAQGQGGLATTHGRGAQKSDTDGVVEFDTVFPGHYTGRATHIHMMSTTGAEVLSNGTFTGGTATHIGQVFMDQDLISQVETTSPYSTNQQQLTTNAQDSIAISEATDSHDPFLNYVMLGDSISDGLLMWITIGIDTTANYNDNRVAASHYYAGGGVANSNSGGAGGAGGPGGAPPNGTAGGPQSGAPRGTTGTTGTVGVTATPSIAAAARNRPFRF
jgi:protocatechuate 3,4-dioxygenase beta subunit